MPKRRLSHVLLYNLVSYYYPFPPERYVQTERMWLVRHRHQLGGTSLARIARNDVSSDCNLCRESFVYTYLLVSFPAFDTLRARLSICITCRVLGAKPRNSRIIVRRLYSFNPMKRECVIVFPFQAGLSLSDGTCRPLARHQDHPHLQRESFF